MKSRKRSKAHRKKRPTKRPNNRPTKRRPKKQTSDNPPPATDKMPPAGWNVDDLSTSQIVRQYADRQRRHIAHQQSVVVAPPLPLAAEGNLVANGEVRPPRPPAIIHEEILERAAALEELTPRLPVGIGHNKPPEPIEIPPPIKVSDVR